MLFKVWERGDREGWDSARWDRGREVWPYETERNERQYDEEERVESNVADFVDDDFDEYATPVCSDDDEDWCWDRWIFEVYKRQWWSEIRPAFDSLEALKKLWSTTC